MAAEDEGKTEEPTGRRLSDARDKGDIAQSVEVRLWASLLTAFILVALLVGRMGSDLANVLVPLLERPHTFEVTAQSLPLLLSQLVWGVLKAMALPLAVANLVMLVVLLTQSRGILWVPDKLIPDFSRMNPLAGIKRMFGPAQLFDLGKQLAKMSVVGTVLVWMSWPHVREYRNLAQLSIGAILSYLQDRIYSLVLAVLLISSVITAADYWFQHWRYVQKMRMTRQELRDEHKQSEGDPMIKGRLRSMRMKRARQRMMQAVPKADVVVTNPTHYAVALKYDMDSMAAPVLVAKGTDLVAKRIRDLAEENEVPVVENPPLARALYATVELDEEIPPEHYKTVAEVISYVMKLKGKIAP